MAPLVFRALPDLLPPRPGPSAQQFRMQFPYIYFKFWIHVVGIATFLDFVESSCNRIACDFAECWPCRPRALRPGRACGIKFSLLGLLVARAVQSSPCWRQMPQNRRFSVCWESFVPGEPTGAACWESFVPDVVSYAVQNSPSSGCWWLERYKVLPADAKCPKIGVFRCIGRVLYRFDPRGLRTGRVLYRAVESGVQGRFRETTGTTADYQFAADRHRTS